VERGRLLADIWASQSEIVSQVLVEQKSQRDAHEAVAAALQRKAAAVDEACWIIEQRNAAQAEQIAYLKRQLAAAQASLQEAGQTVESDSATSSRRCTAASRQ